VIIAFQNILDFAKLNKHVTEIPTIDQKEKTNDKNSLKVTINGSEFGLILNDKYYLEQAKKGQESEIRHSIDFDLVNRLKKEQVVIFFGDIISLQINYVQNGVEHTLHLMHELKDGELQFYAALLYDPGISKIFFCTETSEVAKTKVIPFQIESGEIDSSSTNKMFLAKSCVYDTGLNTNKDGNIKFL
jgi:hypothetical protein